MGSLKTRVIFFVVWLLMGVAIVVATLEKWFVIAAILVAPFFIMFLCMGVVLAGNPLPPRKGDICQQCKFRFATVTKNYWAYNYTIPSGGVKLCDECVNRYDPNYDWGKDKLFNR